MAMRPTLVRPQPVMPAVRPDGVQPRGDDEGLKGVARGRVVGTHQDARVQLLLCFIARELSSEQK
jgi:hypothetical protein